MIPATSDLGWSQVNIHRPAERQAVLADAVSGQNFGVLQQARTCSVQSKNRSMKERKEQVQRQQVASHVTSKSLEHSHCNGRCRHKKSEWR